MGIQYFNLIWSHNDSILLYGLRLCNAANFENCFQSETTQ